MKKWAFFEWTVVDILSGRRIPKDLLEGKKIEAVNHDKLDLVIFVNPLEQTEKDLINIMSKLHKELPNEKILIISPNPVANSKTGNSLEVNYLDYIKASERVINKNIWTYINSMNGIEKNLKKRI
ncbi:hypothetical protein [Peribacillus sp. TH16]|uniref:hypothetical protein n=1 Tax=Peribacillus sp. TH16 TaxID=2798482 RepID=UPI001A9369CD|nr:hypothetical protein [Peribacillus sp. TH16]